MGNGLGFPMLHIKSNTLLSLAAEAAGQATRAVEVLEAIALPL
jgi:hypothetical protein